MKVTKEFILEKAFEQYVINGYSGVSITVLQDSLNIGRATLYYYFENKESLFKEVIRSCYIERIEEEYSEISDSVTIPELIDIFIDIDLMFKKRIMQFAEKYKNVNETNLTALLLYAYTHFTEFKKYFHILKKQKYDFWLRAVLNSIKAGEISGQYDAEMIALIFSNITGESYENRIEDNELTLIPGNKYREACEFFYDRIKN